MYRFILCISIIFICIYNQRICSNTEVITTDKYIAQKKEISLSLDEKFFLMFSGASVKSAAEDVSKMIEKEIVLNAQNYDDSIYIDYYNVICKINKNDIEKIITSLFTVKGYKIINENNKILIEAGENIKKNIDCKIIELITVSADTVCGALNHFFKNYNSSVWTLSGSNGIVIIGEENEVNKLANIISSLDKSLLPNEFEIEIVKLINLNTVDAAAILSGILESSSKFISAENQKNSGSDASTESIELAETKKFLNLPLEKVDIIQAVPINSLIFVSSSKRSIQILIKILEHIDKSVLKTKKKLYSKIFTFAAKDIAENVNSSLLSIVESAKTLTNSMKEGEESKHEIDGFFQQIELVFDKPTASIIVLSSSNEGINKISEFSDFLVSNIKEKAAEPIKIIEEKKTLYFEKIYIEENNSDIFQALEKVTAKKKEIFNQRD